MAQPKCLLIVNDIAIAKAEPKEIPVDTDTDLFFIIYTLLLVVNYSSLLANKKAAQAEIS